MEKYYDVESALKYVAEQPIKFFRLISRGGKMAVPWNNAKGEKVAHLKEVTEALRSDVWPNDIYIIEHRTATKEPSSSILINKGNVSVDNFQPIKVMAEKEAGSEVRTYDNAIKDQTRIVKLEAENEMLKMRLEEMEANEGEELGEAPESVTTTVLTLLKEIALPMLDKHFELRERELAAKATTTQTQVKAPAVYQRPTAYTPATQPTQPTQPTPPSTVIYTGPTAGGSAASWETPKDAPTTVVAEVKEFILNATVDELKTWLQAIKDQEGQDTLNEAVGYIVKFRKLDYAEILEGL